MENNFGQILLNLVSTNKEKFLGLLRRNGVLVNTNVSNVDLTNMLLKAMQKSETFKKEAILLMGVLMSGKESYSNFEGFGNLPTFGTNLGFNSKYIPTTTNETTTTTETTTKKDFADTTVGNIVDKLFKLGEGYLKNKEYDARITEAKEGGRISENKVKLAELGGESDDDGKDKDKDKTGLYVGLAVGGVAVVGVLVYLIAKKK